MLNKFKKYLFDLIVDKFYNECPVEYETSQLKLNELLDEVEGCGNARLVYITKLQFDATLNNLERYEFSNQEVKTYNGVLNRLDLFDKLSVSFYETKFNDDSVKKSIYKAFLIISHHRKISIYDLDTISKDVVDRLYSIKNELNKIFEEPSKEITITNVTIK